jgi:hypothetical protein
MIWETTRRVKEDNTGERCVVVSRISVTGVAEMSRYKSPPPACLHALFTSYYSMLHVVRIYNFGNSTFSYTCPALIGLEGRVLLWIPSSSAFFQPAQGQPWKRQAEKTRNILTEAGVRFCALRQRSTNFSSSIIQLVYCPTRSPVF